MALVPSTPLMVDEYVGWALDHPGRYELLDGRVHKVPPEGAGHAAVKGAVQIALHK